MNNPDLANWLLEAQTPSIRFLTLTRLLELDGQADEVQTARHEMIRRGPIPAILAGQRADGSWSGERIFYSPKFFSSHWSMLLLAELHADPSLPGVRQGAVSVLRRAQDRLKAPEWLDEKFGLACFWANLLRYSLGAGLEPDARLDPLIEYLTVHGIETQWRCRWNGGRPCAWGAVRALWGLAALPTARLTPRVQQSIDSAIHFLLEEHDPLLANYPLHDGGKISPLWRRLNFPLFYQADLLLLLRALAELNRLDASGAQRVLDWLDSLRGKDGRWKGSSPFSRRTWSEMGGAQETHRWVSLYAALLVGA
jgi:hypothetical protein